MNDYYIYAYIRLDNNTYFYIGKGRNNRYKEIYGRSKEFTNIINNVPYEVIILYQNLNEVDAYNIEETIIKDLIFNKGYSLYFFENKGDKVLVNNTYGGKGISGYKYNDEQRKRCARIGENNGSYGKRGELSPIYGRTYSEDHKNKIKMSNPKRKMVYCIELDRYFNSYREAENILELEYNIKCSHASISSICNGRNKKGGYYIDSKLPANLHFKNV